MMVDHIHSSEKALISTMVRYPAVIPEIAGIASADEFSNEQHQRIFATMVKAHSGGIPVELPALTKVLAHEDMLYLVELLRMVTLSDSAAYYAREIRRAARLRTLQWLGLELHHHPDRAASVAEQLREIAEESTRGSSSLFTSAAELLESPRPLTT